MALRDQGFRFVRRGVEFKWVHAAEVLSTDLDCTRMTDEQFHAAVNEALQESFLNGVRVTEMFSNVVPRVRTEKVVKPTGMPPASWALVSDKQVAGADSMMGGLS